MDQNKLIIAIGGNIKASDGTHPIDVGKKAIKLLENFLIFVEKKSCWYISDPIPISDQPKYFNSVIVARTSLNAFDVLNILHKIEKQLGRVRNKVNESRVIDLDLIDYSNNILKKNNLIIPHPRAHLRRFVMEPLAELEPNWTHPIIKINANQILKKLNKQNIKVFLGKNRD